MIVTEATARLGLLIHLRADWALSCFIVETGTAHVRIPSYDTVSTDVLPGLPGILPRTSLSRGSHNRFDAHWLLGGSNTTYFRSCSYTTWLASRCYPKQHRGQHDVATEQLKR